MNLIKRIIGLFSVMEDEVQSFRLLFLQSLFIGFANSYYYIVSSSLLIKNVGIHILPNAYIITGTAGFLLVRVYKALQRKYGISGSYRSVLVIFSVVCFMNFFAMMELGHNKAFAVFLAYFMVLFAGPFTTIFSLGVFAQCSRLYNIAQSKRLLALIVSGEIISSVLAYLSIPFITSLIRGREYVLLPVAGIFILLVFIPFTKLHSIAREKFSIAQLRKAPPKINLEFFRKNKFYTLIGVSTIFSVFAIYIVDYTYLISVRSMHTISGLEIAEIVSVFFFTLKIAELTFSFLSGKILSSRGVRFSLLLLPLILLLLAVCSFVFGYIAPIFMLAFLFLAKLGERAIRKSITTPSVKVMYQVAEPHERLEIESSIDGLLNQVATVFSGIVLLAISFWYFNDDTFDLLHLFSFVCIIAFALWSFFSLKLYDSYRHKIKEFLSLVKSASSGATVADEAAETDVLPVADEHAGMYEQIGRTIEKVQHLGKDELIALLRIYNPRQSLDLKEEREDRIVRRLVHIYYNNHHYFSRLLIIRYLKFCSEGAAFIFLRDLWDQSDLVCRLELIIAFNERAHKHTDPMFFERLAEDCVREIVWTEATLNDISILKDERLERELQSHRSLLVHLLFELLQPVYEPSVIQVIYDIINEDNGDIESQLFALELLDITLEPALKEMIKPLLEPIPFENKKQKLGRIFHIYQLTPVERLVDILMKDYNLVSLQLKEIALIVYSKHGDDKLLLSAFRTNSMDNLRFKAEEFYSGMPEPLYRARLEVLKTIVTHYGAAKSYSAYLFNFALSIPRRNRSQLIAHLNQQSAVDEFSFELRPSSNIAIKLDYLGLALLVTMRQVEMLERANGNAVV